MQLKEFWLTLRRRWYLAVVAILAAGGAGYLVSTIVGPTYQVQSVVLVLPPGTTITGGTATTGNPYLSLGGVSQARDVVIRSLMSSTTHDELCVDSGDAAFAAMQKQLCKNGPEVTYAATPDFTSSAPMILITVEADTRENATTALNAVTDIVPSKLTELQTSLNLPARALITSTPVVVDKNPTAIHKTQLRASIVAVGGVLGLGLLAIALLEGLIGSRRPKSKATAASAEAADAAATRSAKKADAKTARGKTAPTKRAPAKTSAAKAAASEPAADWGWSDEGSSSNGAGETATSEPSASRSGTTAARR